MFILICVILFIAICGLIVYIVSKVNEPSAALIDCNAINMYLEELDRMIKFYSVYEIDAKFGDNFRDKKGVTPEIDNEDITKLIETIGIKVTKAIGPTMGTYLYDMFSTIWINDYIKIRSTSYVIERAIERIDEIRNVVE